MAKAMTLQEQANEILARAEERGVQSNFFFVTTFDRLRTQIAIMEELKKAIKEHGTTVTKTYVKGRNNLVVNPAIPEYNKTSTAANGTVTTLMNIIKNLEGEESSGGKLSALIETLKSE